MRRTVALAVAVGVVAVGWIPVGTEAWPQVSNVNAFPNPADPGEWVTITAVAEAVNSSGTIAQVEYHVDSVNPVPGTGTPMDPDDGAFDEAWENATGWLNTSGLDPGDHTVCVIAEEVQGNSSMWSACGTTVLTINGPAFPVADAGPDQAGSVGQVLTFNGNGSYDPDGFIVSYAWDFGDGWNASGGIVNHAYAAPGVYTVTLTVVDNSSLSDTDTAIVTIGGQPPVADAGPDQAGSVGQVLTFNGNGSYDPDGVIVSYVWYFGDGGNASGAIVTHAYAAPGIYNVTLYVTDDTGDWDWDFAYVTITDGSPNADAGGAYSGRKNMDVAFDGTASSDPGGTVVSYDWDFGDGNVGSGPTPTHAYAAAGNYTVTLTVTDDSNLTDTDVTVAVISDLAPDAPVMVPAAVTGIGLADVLLRWTASADDGGGENDVVGYEVWEGTVYEGSGAGYTLVSTLPPGSTSYDASGAGAGDNTNRFWRVLAVDEIAQETPAAEQAGKVARFLPAGRNLLSIPLEQADWSVGTVLQTLPWTRARTYVNPAGQGKNWWSNDRQKPWADLTALDRKMAVWVETSADAWWTVAGLVPALTEITLKVGWNFIGFPSFAPQTVAQLLVGVNYQTVEGFADDPPFYLRRLSSGDLLSDGNGFWIHISGSDAILTFTN